MAEFNRVYFSVFVPQSLKGKLSTDEIDYWRDEMNRRIGLFDFGQKQRRQQYLERHDLVEDDDDWIDYYFGAPPMNYRSGKGLSIYASDFIDEMFNESHPSRAVGILDREWFEEYTRSKDAGGLRIMPYLDYLKTDHWKRIRNCMLMLNGARCSGMPCGSGDSYWGGGEHMLHVHHLTYKNRGAEKYADLALVCDDCHAAIHAGRKDILYVDLRGEANR